MVRLTIILALAIAGCSSSRHVPGKLSKADIKTIVKEHYFFQCMRQGHDNSEQIESVLMRDRSLFTEAILGENAYRQLDSLAKVTQVRIVKDSISRMGKTAEGSQGRHVISMCLEDYDSKWLEELSEKIYRDYKKDKKDWEKELKRIK